MARFKGFSTVNTAKAPYTLTDSELVKRDLLNEFYTRRGERVMRPTFGSIIWDVLMNPAGPDLNEQVQNDVVKIIGRDPRVQLIDSTVYLMDHTLRVEIEIAYVLTGDTDQLYLTYTRNITEGIDA